MRKPKRLPEPTPEPVAERSALVVTRRSLLSRWGLGATLLALAGHAYALLRALVPNVLYEPPRRVKVGSPDEFAEGTTLVEEHRLFIVRERNTFYAISAVCTHLGCTVKLVSLNQPRKITVRGQTVEERREFHCPCHGSKYAGDGTNYAGPAPRPLDWYKLEIAPDDGQLVVSLSERVGQHFRLTV
jgi:menaquinol-cytochrome c reductase iron-sulfur subunit